MLQSGCKTGKLICKNDYIIIKSTVLYIYVILIMPYTLLWVSEVALSTNTSVTAGASYTRLRRWTPRRLRLEICGAIDGINGGKSDPLAGEITSTSASRARAVKRARCARWALVAMFLLLVRARGRAPCARHCWHTRSTLFHSMVKSSSTSLFAPDEPAQ
jgi:hypothetical protein